MKLLPQNTWAESCLAHTSYHQKKAEIVKTGRLTPNFSAVFQALIIIILIGVLYWFFGTELGAAIRATGCNAAMARAQGINTGLNRVIGLMLSNALVALSGALLAQYQGFADSSR